MEDIKVLIKEWLSKWKECKKCNYMYKVKCNCI